VNVLISSQLPCLLGIDFDSTRLTNQPLGFFLCGIKSSLLLRIEFVVNALKLGGDTSLFPNFSNILREIFIDQLSNWKDSGMLGLE